MIVLENHLGWTTLETKVNLQNLFQITFDHTYLRLKTMVCALEDPKYDKVTSTKGIEFLSRMLRRSSSKSSYISLLSLTYAATLLTTRSYAKRVNWAGHDSQAEKGRHG